MTYDLEKYAVLDFEACGLSNAIWPIEVGVSMLQSGRVETWSSLIRPDDDWDQSEWSEASAEIHGISMADLDYAPPAAVVARQLLDRVSGRIVLSDAPGYERLWLNRLLDVVGRRDAIRIQDYHAVTKSVLSDDPYGLDRVLEWLACSQTPHRAGPDAERMVRGWLQSGKTSANSLDVPARANRPGLTQLTPDRRIGGFRPI